jgi:hypothetical protein
MPLFSEELTLRMELNSFPILLALMLLRSSAALGTSCTPVQLRPYSATGLIQSLGTSTRSHEIRTTRTFDSILPRPCDAPRYKGVIGSSFTERALTITHDSFDLTFPLLSSV